MTIKIFNTLHKKKEDLITIRDDRVSMYVCGPTVYSYPHIGNARAAIIPDILFRLLKSSYKEVIYIRNITDVDDKIFDAAKKENIPFNEISKKFTKIYQNDMSALNILEPTFQPKVTDNIPAIISTIKKILDNGYAYISDEHVIFDTQKYNKYGELSKRSLDEMLDGVRIDIDSTDSTDFILQCGANGGSTEVLNVMANGRVGVMDTTPSYPLDVVGDGGGSFSASTNSTNGVVSVVGKNSSGSVSAISRIKSYPDGSSNQSHMAFETRNSSSQMVERVRLTSGGKIGFNYAAAPPSEDIMICTAGQASPAGVSLSHLSGGNRYGLRLQTISGTNAGISFSPAF